MKCDNSIIKASTLRVHGLKQVSPPLYLISAPLRQTVEISPCALENFFEFCVRQMPLKMGKNSFNNFNY